MSPNPNENHATMDTIREENAEGTCHRIRNDKTKAAEFRAVESIFARIKACLASERANIIFCEKSFPKLRNPPGKAENSLNSSKAAIKRSLSLFFCFFQISKKQTK